MDIRTTYGLLIILLWGCNDNQQKSFAQSTVFSKPHVDTIVGSKTITNEIPGSAYRKKAIGYFVIIGNDTCIFTESKDDNKVGIDLNIKYLKASMTYRQRLKELKIILPKAATDFNFDSLTGIGFGRLILSGDLAIDVTKQYRQKFGASNKLQSYPTVQQFLKQSKLCEDIDNLFKPYSISSDRVSFEKLFLTSRKELYWASKIEADTSNVPDKILDCNLGVKLKKR